MTAALVTLLAFAVVLLVGLWAFVVTVIAIGDHMDSGEAVLGIGALVGVAASAVAAVAVVALGQAVLG